MLNNLFDELKNGQTPLTTGLPVYGDPSRSNREGVWSWDCEREIVGTCIDDLEIVARDDAETMTTRTYACEGDVRGQCEHKHRTVAAARKCFDADYNGCKSVGGYSDRTRLVVFESGEVIDATDAEIEEWHTGHC